MPGNPEINLGDNHAFIVTDALGGSFLNNWLASNTDIKALPKEVEFGWMLVPN